MSIVFNEISGEITMDDITKAKAKIKEVEKLLKEKNKPKTITIKGDSHSKIKTFCEENNLNIGEWTSDILLKEVDRVNNDVFVKLRKAQITRAREILKGVDLKEDCTIMVDEEDIKRDLINKELIRLEKFNRDSYKWHDYKWVDSILEKNESTFDID